MAAYLTVPAMAALHHSVPAEREPIDFLTFRTAIVVQQFFKRDLFVSARQLMGRCQILVRQGFDNDDMLNSAGWSGAG